MSTKAAQFAENISTSIEQWMLWSGWYRFVGCGNCQEIGEDADCWGLSDCHGYRSGCGCAFCCSKEDALTEILMNKMEKFLVP